MQIAVREKAMTKCTARARAYCISAFRPIVCMHIARHQERVAGDKATQHPEIKYTMDYQHGRKELPAAYQLGETPGG